jgi:LmbE family N-acetylglucosaminyl deacetylase
MIKYFMLLELITFIIELLIYLSVFWIIIVLLFNDLTVPTKYQKFKNVLLIYPHPDDEVLTAGGFLTRLHRDKSQTYLLCLTKGENYTRKPSDEIKVVRSVELMHSAKSLQIDKVIHMDLGDGQITENSVEAERAIREIISEVNPDLIITYDLSGLYGHPDHIKTAEITTKVCKELSIRLWYSSMPQKILDKMNLPIHMAIDKSFADHRSFPTFKTYIGLEGVIRKIRALYAHKSQMQNLSRGNPMRYIPMWIPLSFFVFEYFYEVKND